MVESVLDEMYDFEEEFEDIEKQDGKYYIGIYIYMNDIPENDKKLFLGMTVSTKLFFKYEHKYVYKYLCSAVNYCPYEKYYDLKINILKLHIDDNQLYLVTVKTYWLKLIQRHWKNIIKKRKELHVKMSSWINLYWREIRGISPLQKNYPKLQGMLSAYSNKKEKYIHCHS